MAEVKFSIAVPAYKSTYLEECIASILKQSDPDFEVVIVNDASPYNLDSIVEAFRDERIRYYKNQTGFGGQKLVGNWNKALEYCRGEYVILMGDDDRLLPDCLSYYREAVTADPACDVFHIRSQIINDKGEVIGRQDERAETESALSFLWEELKGYRNQFIGDFLFKTKTLKELGGFYDLPWAWCSDRITVLEAAEKTGIRNLNPFGFQYRMHAATISESSDSVEDKVKAYKKAEAWYRNFLLGREENRSMLRSWGVNDAQAQEMLRSAMRKRFSNVIAFDLASRPLRVFYWLARRKRYGYSGTDVLKSCRTAIRRKCRGSRKA